MAYTALYRKWRPDEFQEVKGQEHVVATLKNQVIHQRIGHAYLFCGTRGTGKTTIARLFAKSINCEKPVEGSPCGECESCKSIQSNSSMNILEIDAASNNGVESMREIINNVQYPPTEGKYKVYIIDEVHMLTKEAFAALLKTLEEPPAYAVFIMATTENYKIPITVKSRSQCYDFHRIKTQVIASRLAELMEREGIEAEPRAIDYVAKVADGSMRDALSLLDQCISFYLGSKVTYENCLEVLGAVDTDIFQRLLKQVEDKAVSDAVDTIDEIAWNGQELDRFIVDFTWFMRNLLLLKTSSQMGDKMDYSQEKIKAMTEMAKNISMNNLMRYIRIFSELSNTIRYASQKRVLLELAVIKLCIPEMEQDYSSIIQRLDDLGRQVEELQSQPVTPVIVESKATESEKEQEERAMKEQLEQLPIAEKEDLYRIAESFKKITSNLQEDYLRMFFLSIDVYVDPVKKCIVIPEQGDNAQVLAKEDVEVIEMNLAKLVHMRVPIEVRKMNDNRAENVNKKLISTSWLEDLIKATEPEDTAEEIEETEEPEDTAEEIEEESH